MIYHNDEQGSEAWLISRLGVITGSRYKDCRDRKKDKSPSAKCALYAMDTARERVGGKVAAKFQTAAMREGQVQESMCRMAYEARTGAIVEEVGFITTDDRLYGVSPDGLIGEDGVLEIKTMVSSDTLFTALINGDISEYIDQCLGYLWLLGRKWVDLVLWAPDLEHIGLGMKIIRISRTDNEDKIQALEDDLVWFAKEVAKNEAAIRVAAKEASAVAA